LPSDLLPAHKVLPCVRISSPFQVLPERDSASSHTQSPNHFFFRRRLDCWSLSLFSPRKILPFPEESPFALMDRVNQMVMKVFFFFFFFPCAGWGFPFLSGSAARDFFFFPFFPVAQFLDPVWQVRCCSCNVPLPLLIGGGGFFSPFSGINSPLPFHRWEYPPSCLSTPVCELPFCR